MEKPEGYKIQQALRWVASEMALRPGLKRWQLASEAAQRFDLDPRESELLLTQKLPQHPVEGRSQLFELVARVDDCPLLRVATANRVAHVTQMG